MDDIGGYEEIKRRVQPALQERETLDRQLEEGETVPAVTMHPGELITAEPKADGHRVGLLTDGRLADAAHSK